MKSSLTSILKIHFFIHLFALAHILAVILLSWIGWDDSLFLTILTILMISTLAIQHNYPLDSTFVAGVFACITGYYLGTWGSKLLALLTHLEGVPLRSLCTFIITEVLGWSIYLITHHRENKERQR